MKTKLRQWLRRIGLKRSYPNYCGKRFRLRLVSVQQHLAEALDVAAAGPLKIISICAGNGQDVIGVLSRHRRRIDISACLVEINPRSIADGLRLAKVAGVVDSVKFQQADATMFETYRNIAPADIVMLCGVWGHVPRDQRALLVQSLARFCKPGASVIWTRGVRDEIHRVREIQQLFDRSSWELFRDGITTDGKWAVVTHRYRGPIRPLPASGKIFHFRSMAGAA